MKFVLKAVNESTGKCREIKNMDTGKTISSYTLPAYTLHAGKSVVIYQYGCHLLRAFV